MQERSKRRPESSRQMVKHGIIALCRCQIPLAFTTFQAVYHSPNWQLRDIAVAGLGDILDTKFYAGEKAASAILAANWQPPGTLPKTPPPIPIKRLLLLADGFILDSQFQPQNPTEIRFRNAMRQTLKMLENILLNDAHYLVRFSAFAVLTHVIGEDKRHFILSTLKKAQRQETNPLLSDALASYMGQ
ncbi:MAG: hypothetical protein KJ064_25180 [Anaerolineae bacterium]|nr:hypothetical protein [Anaerolineae bacterium]